MNNYALELDGISKKFGTFQVVDDMNFRIKKNTIFGLMGPNGAGKTTIIRILTRILLADKGNISFFGESFKPDHIKSVGYMPEQRGLYRSMKVIEHLMYMAKLHNIPRADARERIDNWLIKMEMIESKKKLISQLSKGMSQKIQFISSVLHKPKLLILDEPFSGLDPISASVLEEQLKRVNKDGTTIILSTHIMEQIEHFCEDILLINKGKKVINGNMEMIKNQFKDGSFLIKGNKEIPAEILTKFNITEKDQNHYVKFSSEDEQTQFLTSLLSHNITLKKFNEILPSMREIFISQMGDSSE